MSRAYQEEISRYNMGPLWANIIHTCLVHNGAMSEIVQGKEDTTHPRKGYIIKIEQ